GTSSVVSALRAISSSVWPTPTVSTRMRAKPNASSRSATSSVVVARPPCAPRVAMERMKTCGARLADSIRMRSPSSAPPVNGLVGATATTPTESPCAREGGVGRSASAPLPAPRGAARGGTEFQSRQGDPLPRPGDAPRRLEQKAPLRLRAPRVERDAEALVGPARRGVALDLDDAGGGLAGGGRRRARLEGLRHQ